MHTDKTKAFVFTSMPGEAHLDSPTSGVQSLGAAGRSACATPLASYQTHGAQQARWQRLQILHILRPEALTVLRVELFVVG